MRTVFIVLLFLALAKATYAEESCAKKSVNFAFCVNASYLDHVSNSQTKSELEKSIRNDCAQETAAYSDCDQIDKTAFVNEFIQKKVESFKKDAPKAVAKLHQAEPDSPDTLIN